MTELTVIRCNHNYNAWKAVRSEVGWAFAGTFRSFERPTAADAVASGALSGVPCKTVDITDAACSIAPWDTLPRAMSDAGAREACLKRSLEHVARNARVLADEHGRVSRQALAAKNAACGLTEAQHEVGRDRRLADTAANTVRTKITTSHDCSP